MMKNNMKLFILLPLVMFGCAGKVETLPPTCSFNTEKVREQLCADDQSTIITCYDINTKSPANGCTGPKTESVAQITGTAWCCE